MRCFPAIMDARADTLSGRFGGQWAFLSNPPHPAQARSLPPSSSYLRSDRSNVSPLPAAFHFQQLNVSRSNLPRNAQPSSIGGHSSTTIPSQPVLVPVHAADASIQIRPTTRLSRPDKNMSKKNELPPIQEFSMRGILAAIGEDIEEDVNAISEIFGRSRLVLADQHESHLPPQGEIRATNSPLQAVAEASSSNERLAATDNVLILREDASLVEGSHGGSTAYDLLERLQAVPRTAPLGDEIPAQPISSHGTNAVINYTAQAGLTDMSTVVEDHGRTTHSGFSHLPRLLLQNQQNADDHSEPPPRTTNAVVSETYLTAGANAVTISDPPFVSESGRRPYALYGFDDRELFEAPLPPASPPRTSFRTRMQSFIPRRELANLAAWLHGRSHRAVSAESQLRHILERQRQASESDDDMETRRESADLYE